MTSVSQNGRRARRPWTAQDQTTAEVAAACGVSYRDIGLALDRAYSLVRTRLSAHAADVSQKGAIGVHLSQKRRPWTAQDQTTAEVAAACGMSNKEIGQLLSRSAKTVRIKLCHSASQRDQAWSRQHYKANPEKKKKCHRKWLNANPGYCRAHGAAYSESSRRWRKANPEKIREKARRRNAWKRAARRAALHPVTRAQIDARFALWSNRCAFCGADATHQRNYGRERLTVEHVLALTKGGLDEASNIIPACTACNSSKNNSPIEDWYRQREWFTEARWAKIQRHCPAAVVGQLPLGLAA